jgi:hypothetical protein
VSDQRPPLSRDLLVAFCEGRERHSPPTGIAGAIYRGLRDRIERGDFDEEGR